MKKIELSRSEFNKLQQAAKLINEFIERIESPDKPKKKVAKKSPGFEAHLQASTRLVLAHYQKLHPGKARNVGPGHKMFKLILDRLSEGLTKEELCQAIDGNLKCTWHKERAGGHGISFIFRNQEKVERFIELADGKQEKPKKIGHHAGSKEFGDGAKGFNID